MSLTKRWIDDMREEADAGNVERQNFLESVGLWSSPETQAEEAEFDRLHYEQQTEFEQFAPDLEETEIFDDSESEDF